MKLFLTLALLLAFGSPMALQAGDAESQIRTVLKAQVKDWNAGDIPAFVTTYAPDCIFVGKQVAKGKAQLLARYKKTYPTRAAMGQLIFSAVEIDLLTSDVAIVTGQWHVERSGTQAKSIGGLFSLVLHRQSHQWKIVLDHTS
jgi:uncharacterized protein (TIGR02246 family)